MASTADPKRKTQSITIKDVPTEYVELFNDLVERFAFRGNRYIDQIHTSPQAHPDMPKGELRTLFFCELIHHTYDKQYLAGSAAKSIKDHKEYRDVICSDSGPE